MIRAASGISSPDEAVRVAAAVDPLVVGEDDLGDRAVALDPLDEPRALLRMAADDLAICSVRQPRLGEQDRVGEDELADVVQEAGRVDDVLLALGQAELAGDLARVAGDRGGVARGHLVAQRERLQHRAEEADLERGELARAPLELLLALHRAQRGPQQVLEDEADDGEQADRARVAVARRRARRRR